MGWQLPGRVSRRTGGAGCFWSGPYEVMCVRGQLDLGLHRLSLQTSVAVRQNLALDTFLPRPRSLSANHARPPTRGSLGSAFPWMPRADPCGSLWFPMSTEVSIGFWQLQVGERAVGRWERESGGANGQLSHPVPSCLFHHERLDPMPFPLPLSTINLHIHLVA